jgi:hypothetical protein
VDGGVIQYINQYAGCLAGFVARRLPSATATTSSRRSRWSPKAEKGEIYE